MNTPLLADISTRLAPMSDTPALDASVLIAHVTQKPRTWVLSHPELTLTSKEQAHLTDSLARLERGEALPYVLGHWEFFGLEFDVTPDVLIPRPETELLVEKAIASLQGFSTRRTVADVGTGSGAIAVSIAVHVPDVDIIATDISPKALNVAKSNAEKFGVGARIELIECDLLPDTCSPLPIEQGFGVRVFDLICANLPYIATQKLRNLPIYNREPTLALDGGTDGLDLFRKLLGKLPKWLTPDGMVLLEIEATQGLNVLTLAQKTFPRARISLHKDLTGKDRLLQVELA